MIVSFQKMPPKVRGMTVRSCDNGEEYYTIIINSILTKEQQEKTYRHELFHIENGDFNSDESVGEIERRAHEY